MGKTPHPRYLSRTANGKTILREAARADAGGSALTETPASEKGTLVVMADAEGVDHRMFTTGAAHYAVDAMGFARRVQGDPDAYAVRVGVKTTAAKPAIPRVVARAEQVVFS